jgi:hypothetical protein
LGGDSPYRFEKFGLGALVLQETQNPLELVDVEFSMAYIILQALIPVIF